MKMSVHYRLARYDQDCEIIVSLPLPLRPCVCVFFILANDREIPQWCPLNNKSLG